MTTTLSTMSIVLMVLLALSLIALIVVFVQRRSAIQQAYQDGERARELDVVALERDLDATHQRVRELSQRAAIDAAELTRLRQRLDILADERALLAAKAERAEQMERRASQLETAWREARELASEAQVRVAELTTRLHEQREATEIRLREFDDRLKAELGQLANGLLEEKVRHFDARSEKQIGGLLAPLREQLSQFNQAVTQTQVEIQSLKQLNQQITTEAANLTRALKGDTRSQGAWGELVLERLLEMSGLQSGRGFDVQAVFKDDEGGRPRPDVIVHLPDNKDVVIDAKVSLIAWDRALSAEGDSQREQAMKEHVGSLRRHIEGLGKRDYSTIKGLQTLDFVLMFVPVEAAFIEALRRDESLYSYALDRNIALVSPSTLLATLRTVAHLWKLEDRNLNAQEIARQAGALHDSFVMLEKDFHLVGEQIERAMQGHHNAMRRISLGKGNLLGRVDRLRKLGADARKALPEARFESEAVAFSSLEPNK